MIRQLVIFLISNLSLVSKVKFFSLLMTACLWPAISFAQSASPDFIDPGKELKDRLERERREEEIRRFRSVPDTIRPTLVNPERANEGPCVQINDIILEGITLLGKYEQKKLLEGKVPECLGRYHISNLMRSIDKAYVDKGFITARTYIPEQDVQKTNVLKLQVVEGRVEEVKLIRNKVEVGKSAYSPGKWTAFLNRTGGFLNVRDF